MIGEVGHFCLAVALMLALAQSVLAQAGAPAGAAAAIEGTVTVSARLRDRIAPGTTLFVFARSQRGDRMPLAIVKVPTAHLPLSFRLDDSQAMTPQFRLAGTLEAVKVGSRDIRLVIDKVLP